MNSNDDLSSSKGWSTPTIQSGIEKRDSSGDSKNSSSVESTRPQSTGREETEIAKAENQAVLRIRLIIAAFMVVCTFGAAWLVYAITKRQESDTFEEDLHDFATKVFESFGNSLDQSLGALDSFVVSVVSFVASSGMEWPFVNIPNSGTGLAKVRSITKAVAVVIMPKVDGDLREAWNEFSLDVGPTWVDDNLRIQKNDPSFHGNVLETYETGPLHAEFDIAANKSVYYPDWQSYPTASTLFYPYNFDSSTIFNAPDVWERKVQLKDVQNGPETGDLYNMWLQDFVSGGTDFTEPVSDLHYPIFDDAANEILLTNSSSEGEFVAILWVTFYWRDFFEDILPSGTNGLVVVITNACNHTFTYQINGPSAMFLGFGDHHDPEFDYLVQTSRLEDLGDYASGSRLYTGLPLSDEQCPHTIHIYPSDVFEEKYTSSNPWVYTVVTVAIFIFTTGVFGVYDCFVERRQKKVMTTAMKSSAIVSSLFPSNVRARLYDMEANDSPDSNNASQKNRLKTFMRGISDEGEGKESKYEAVEIRGHPIADLFPETTVMFGDIAGFTAWSSTRAPSQVFILLESLYGAFDSLALKRGVFKVETIGDCYVAVAGLPDPRPDHAVVMARFALHCTEQMMKLMSQLSVTLGPDTEDLSMRFGLNSGPVTAGVLRGQKSRFQLFGDTVNTAARMESSGQNNRIHATQSTADELIKHKKGHWIQPRKDKVEIKGKGRMTTYWVDPHEPHSTPSESRERKTASFGRQSPGNMLPMTGDPNTGVKIDRLVDWNVEVLSHLIRAIVARRATRTIVKSKNDNQEFAPMYPSGRSPIDEVKEIVTLPEFDANQANDDPDSIKLEPLVISQLRDYVAAIATTYKGSNNPFHNFEHASHVCMSVSKLMSRIVAADEFFDERKGGGPSIELFKHQRTFGIASDPLTLFSCGFAALIHDADHPGVPNTQLVAEGTDLAKKYGNRSIAEQRSVDVAWELLMESRFNDLRKVICPTNEELRRFRQLIVNSVMATDIMDKELKQLRNDRWDKAFDRTDEESISGSEAVNRKATIVIEHLIQASDVAHTMQHWHVYRKWNERLFAEMYQAYAAGRAEKNPADYWYKGELGFFDFYILPLAKKLSSCGVFGVSSNEYLNYAVKNREEWESKGEEVVAEMVETLKGAF